MKYTKEYLEPIVKDSTNTWEVLEKVGMKKQGGNYRYIREYIKKYNISIEHFVKEKRGKGIEIEKILVKNKFLTLSGNSIKRRLYKEGLKTPICELCGQDENWKGKHISMILDHQDGDRDNNEIENLRIVCPNCNATLDTHCGKNRGKYKERKFS